METPPALTTLRVRPFDPTGRLVRLAMLGFAFLLPFLSWGQAMGIALLALLFNAYLLPEFRAAKGPPEPGSAWTARFGTREALYTVSLLLVLLIFRHSEIVVAAVWGILAAGNFAAETVGSAWSEPALPWNPEKTLAAGASFTVAGTAAAYVLSRWVAPTVPADRTFFICLATSFVGALAATAPLRLDNHLTVALAASGFMFCALYIQQSALDSNAPYLGVRIVLALLVNALFALLAWVLRFATRSGALAGFVLGVTIYMGYGWKSFLILLGFFALASVATRLGYAKKASRGIAERQGGARSWREAGANLLAAAFFSILVITTHREAAFLAALVAALAEAAGDTVSSEIGKWLSEQAYLLTTLEPVPSGEDGGISFPGSLAGVGASVVIAALSVAVGLCRPGVAAWVLAAAVAGNLLDSLLGATLERRGCLNNSAVNLAGTSFAGALTLAVMLR